MLASDVIDGARLTLIDAAKVTWSDAELLGYLNEALRSTAFVKPDMFTRQEFVPLAAGTLQELPADGVALMEISENQASGRVVTIVDRSMLDEAARFWPKATRQAEVEHYTADPRTPRRFTVFPPNDGTGSVRALYGAIPPSLTTLTSELGVSETYQAPLLAYVLARAYAKNTKKQDLAKTNGYTGQWGQLLGLKQKGQAAAAPRVTEVPGAA